jgi:hypothetical protein
MLTNVVCIADPDVSDRSALEHKLQALRSVILSFFGRMKEAFIIVGRQ